MENSNIYDDIAIRTDGNIYIGVVGPVRTGKSTFIKRFMEVMVIPNVENSYSKARIVDELPQSSGGKTIYTTEPKFVPNEAVKIRAMNNLSFDVKMVDCVGYMIPGASGENEDGSERMVKTPWTEKEIPFSEAASIGTDKVINEHSTIAVVVTTDGSIGEHPRESYIESEEKTVNQLKALKKPFVILLNTAQPMSNQSKGLCLELNEKYNVPVLPINCAKMNEEDIDDILEKILYQFPATEINFDLPSYLDALDKEHWIKVSIIDSIKEWMNSFETIGSITGSIDCIRKNELIEELVVTNVDLATGVANIETKLNGELYYKVIEEIMGKQVSNDGQLFALLKEYVVAKKGYDSLRDALAQVKENGYGIVQPKLSEMELKEPEVFKQGNKYGVRLTAKAPCLHIIKTDITTEVSPVVGTESQSRDLVTYLNSQFGENSSQVWDTNLFGKSLQDMMTEQMDSKLANVPEALRLKVQKSLQRISNEGKDYFVCIIL